MFMEYIFMIHFMTYMYLLIYYETLMKMLVSCGRAGGFKAAGSSRGPIATKIRQHPGDPSMPT
jgi:hypothetical protein